MLAVEKWAEGKSPLVALFAPQIASLAQDIHKAFVDIKNRRLYEYQFQLPHLPTWLSLYRSHHKPVHFIKTLFRDFSPYSPNFLSLADELDDFSKAWKKTGAAELKKEMSQFTPVELAALVEEVKSMLNSFVSESFHGISVDVDDEPVNSKVREAFLKRMEVVEAGFFYLVTAPCWILYQDSPTRIYREARRGDFESMEKLIRLDPLIIHDPYIGKQIQQLRLNKKMAKFTCLIEAIQKQPKVKFTRKKMKYAFAGLISAFSAANKVSLDEPQIRALFDAVAQDYLKEPIDTELADSPETFSKAIQRNRKPWLPIFSPDIKK